MHGDIDLDAYFARIGYDGPREPTLDVLSALCRLHPEAIPFESLDPLFGRPVLIDAASLERKLVRGSRGGYCFEQNGVFFRVLRSLGFKVTPLSARVGWMLPLDAPRPPLSHMLIRVDLPEGPFLADVGFGGQSPPAPLRMAPDIEQSTSHGVYRFLEDDDALALQMRLPDRWETLYRFTQAPQGAADYEISNWYTSTHPASRFTGNLIAARVDGARRLNLFNRDLTTYDSAGRGETRKLSGAGEVHKVLTRDFRLDVERGEIDRVFDRLPAPDA
jgi:N-hydroxyarylamine O-acetyltransferase